MSDYAAVADIKTFIPELTKQLKQRTSKVEEKELVLV